MGGRLVGVVVGIVTAVSFDFFLTVPYGSLTMERRDDVPTTVLLAIVGPAGGEPVERARHSEAEALAPRAEVELFQRRVELVVGGEPSRLISTTSEELAPCSTSWPSATRPGRHQPT